MPNMPIVPIMPIMPIAHHAYCLSCLLPIKPNMPIITTPRAKDKGKQAAHHIVCEQHAPLFILHRAPASKLVPPSHPILRERKLKPLFRGPETAMQHTGKRQKSCTAPRGIQSKVDCFIKDRLRHYFNPVARAGAFDCFMIKCKLIVKSQERETKARTARLSPPAAPQRLISVSKKSFVMLPVRLIKSKRPECLIISTISTIYLPLRRTYRRLPARSAYNL